MKLKCGQCQKRYRLQDSLIAPEGIQVRCPNCMNLIPVIPTNRLGNDHSDSFENTSYIPSGTEPYQGDDFAGDLDNGEELIDESMIIHSGSQEVSGFDEKTSVGTTSFSGDTKTNVAQLSDSEEESEKSSFSKQPSISAEISEISFVSSEVSEVNEQKPSDTKTQQRSNAHSNSLNEHEQTPLAATAINPNLQSPNKEQRKRAKQNSQFSLRKFILNNFVLWLLPLLLLIIVVSFFAVKTDNKKIETPSVDPSIVKYDIENQVSREDLLEIEAAIALASESALNYAKRLLGSVDQDGGVATRIAYCNALLLLLFNKSELNNVVTEVLTRQENLGYRDLYGVIAKSIQMAMRGDEKVSTSLRELRDVGEASSDESMRQRVMAFEYFIQAISAKREGDQRTAAVLINKAVSQFKKYGVFLVFSQSLSNSSKDELETWGKLLQNTRAEILDLYPGLKYLVRSIAPAVSATVSEKTEEKPKTVTKTVKERPKQVIVKKTVKPNKPKNDYFEFIRVGNEKVSKQMYKDAIVEYEKALKVASARQRPDVLIKIGNAWYGQYRLDEAFKFFDQAVKLDSNRADAHKGLGKVYDHLGDIENAIREYSLYLQLKPDAEDAQLIRNAIKSLEE